MYSLTLPVLKGMKMDPLMGVWEPQVEIRVGERAGGWALCGEAGLGRPVEGWPAWADA